MTKYSDIDGYKNHNRYIAKTEGVRSRYARSFTATDPEGNTTHFESFNALVRFLGYSDWTVRHYLKLNKPLAGYTLERVY